MSARQKDINGWIEIEDNPISKVGVFEYSGKQISPELEPDKIYNVYRSAEELSDPECIESFKLLPWIDDHVMLGDGQTAAEKKGLHGVVGENVRFDDGYLKANLKIFSEKLSKLIENGKKELSIGYRCVYDLVSGVYNGVRYDAVQRNIRGNHLALVDEGRAGSDVAVLDHFIFTFDTKEFKKMVEKENDCRDESEEEITLEALAKKVAALTEVVAKLADSKDSEEEKVKDEEEKEEAKDNEEETKDSEEEKVKDEEEKSESMDAKLKSMRAELTKSFLAELSQRDQLASQLSKHVGTFDHADKTLNEVAQYGVKKLGLSVAKGQELAALTGFLAGRKNEAVKTGFDHRGKQKASSVDAYLSE